MRFLQPKKSNVVFLLLILFTSASQAATFTDLVVFGDSLSDMGNRFNLDGTPASPYFNGRASNGPVWVETLATNLGIAGFAASTNGGTNYAYGGANTGPLGDSPPSLLDQSATYLTDVAGMADPNALYVIFGGGNDIRDFDTSSTAINIGTIISDLAGAGATNIVVANLPNVGRTPDAIDAGLSLPAQLLTTGANAQIATVVANSEASLGLDIIELDVFAFLESVFATTPAPFGLTDLTQRCYDPTVSPTPCANPAEFLFWDGIHPSAVAHEELGNFAFAAIVPVPPAIFLFGSALTIAGFIRRRAA